MSDQDHVKDAYLYNKKGKLVDMRNDFLKSKSMHSLGDEIGGALSWLDANKWNPEIAFIRMEETGRYSYKGYEKLREILNEVFDKKLNSIADPELTESEKAASLIKFLEYQNNDRDDYSRVMTEKEKHSLYERLKKDELIPY